MACLLCSNTLRIVAKLTLPLLLAACASSPAPAPNANANAAATTSASPSKPAPAAKADAPDPALRKLWLTARYVELIDCGHNGAVGPLRCEYTASSRHQPTHPNKRLRVFVTEPPGLVLAAVEWDPRVVLRKAEVMLADCSFERLGRFSTVRFGAREMIPGWLYGGPVEVGRAHDCSFAKGTLPAELAASHLLVAYQKAQRAPISVKRDKIEAMDRAYDAAQSKQPFAKLVARYSDDTASKSQQGRLGSFRPGMMATSFEMVLLATPIGKRSPAFETAYGFHVLQRDR